MTSIYDLSANLTQLPVSVVQHFNFTAAESNLCLGLVQGKTLGEIAQDATQTREELRLQFDTLLTKTGTDNESKLISVVLSNASLSCEPSS